MVFTALIVIYESLWRSSITNLWSILLIRWIAENIYSIFHWKQMRNQEITVYRWAQFTAILLREEDLCFQFIMVTWRNSTFFHFASIGNQPYLIWGNKYGLLKGRVHDGWILTKFYFECLWAKMHSRSITHNKEEAYVCPSWRDKLRQ